MKNQSRGPADPETTRLEPDGPRDPVGERCLMQLAAKRKAAGRSPPQGDEVVVLRGAAKAGKSAALFQAFAELKASRQAG